MGLDKLLVIGASRGIGRFFIEDNLKIAKDILGIGTSAINLSGIGDHKVRYEQVDIADYERAAHVVSEWLSDSKFERIGILNAAAILGAPGGIFSTEITNLSKVLSVNLIGHANVIKCLEPYLRNGVKANILMLAGGGAAYGYPDFFAYAVSKAALVRMVENIHLESKKNNFDLNIVALAPGAVETDMLQKIVDAGGYVKTKTKIEEPSLFIKRFLTNELEAYNLSGRFIHVRDELDKVTSVDDIFMLRRVE